MVVIKCAPAELRVNASNLVSVKEKLDLVKPDYKSLFEMLFAIESADRACQDYKDDEEYQAILESRVLRDIILAVKYEKDLRARVEAEELKSNNGKRAEPLQRIAKKRHEKVTQLVKSSLGDVIAKLQPDATSDSPAQANDTARILLGADIYLANNESELGGEAEADTRQLFDKAVGLVFQPDNFDIARAFVELAKDEVESARESAKKYSGLEDESTQAALEALESRFLKYVIDLQLISVSQVNNVSPGSVRYFVPLAVQYFLPSEAHSEKHALGFVSAMKEQIQTHEKGDTKKKLENSLVSYLQSVQARFRDVDSILAKLGAQKDKAEQDETKRLDKVEKEKKKAEKEKATNGAKKKTMSEMWQTAKAKVSAEEEKKKLKNRIKKLEGDIDRHNTERTSLMQFITALRADSSKQQEPLSTSEDVIAALESEIQELTAAEAAIVEGDIEQPRETPDAVSVGGIEKPAGEVEESAGNVEEPVADEIEGSPMLQPESKMNTTQEVYSDVSTVADSDEIPKTGPNVLDVRPKKLLDTMGHVSAGEPISVSFLQSRTVLNPTTSLIASPGSASFHHLGVAAAVFTMFGVFCVRRRR